MTKTDSNHADNWKLILLKKKNPLITYAVVSIIVRIECTFNRRKFVLMVSRKASLKQSHLMR